MKTHRGQGTEYLGCSSWRMLGGGRGRRISGVGILTQEVVNDILQSISSTIHLTPVVVPCTIENQPLKLLINLQFFFYFIHFYLMIGMSSIVFPVVCSPIVDSVPASYPSTLGIHTLICASDGSESNY